jgi:hypothetical protein
VSQPPYRFDETQPGGWGSDGVPVPPMPSYPPNGVGPYGSQPYGSQPYGSQPYGSQPYGSQPYGYPGYDPYGQPPRRGNGMAIAGFVLSFFVGLLGLIFSSIGLRRSREPGRSGRGLAIAGLVISAVNIVVSILIAVGAASGSTATDSSSVASSSTAAASSTAPAPAPGSETVADACHVIIPAVTGVQADLQSATSVADMLNKITQLAATVQQQGVASGDPDFTQHTATLADQYRALLHAGETGGKPDYTALAKAGEQVGYDCGRVGVTA